MTYHMQLCGQCCGDLEPALWPSGKTLAQRSGGAWFEPRPSQTKDFKVSIFPPLEQKKPFLCENQPGISLQTQDLYQLAQYLQEALHREKMLEQKLLSLQQLVHNTQEASESGWQALIDEDKLLSRLEMLENQLHIYSKNHSEDTLRQELQALQEDKNKYETTSKESLRRVLQEKLEAVTKLSDLEQSLGNMRDECSHLKEACETSQGELAQLAVKYQEQLKEVAELQEKLQEAEESYHNEQEKADQEKAEISHKLEEMVQQESSLSAKIESLQADNDFTKEQLAAMKAKLESVKEANEDDQKLSELDLNGSTTEVPEIIPLGPPKEDDVPENLQAKLKDLQKLIEVYKNKLENSDAKLKESNEKIEQLQKDLEVAISNSKEYLVKISSLEVQLKESAKQSNSSNDWIETMKDHIQLMEKELTNQTPVNSVENSTDSLDGTSPSQNSESPSSPTLPFPSSISTSPSSTEQTATGSPPLSSSPPLSGVLGAPPDLLSNTTVMVNGSSSSSSNSNGSIGDEDSLGAGRAEECGEQQETNLTVTEVGEGEEEADVTVMEPSQDNQLTLGRNTRVPDLDQDEDLKALLEEARQGQQKAEVELRRYRDEASDSQSLLQRSSEELTTLKFQLAEAQQQAKEKADMVADLQDQLKKAESLSQDVKQQILDLREKMASEGAKLSSTEKELEEAKMQLAMSQQNAKQNHNETEHLKDKLRHLQEELDSERNRRDSSRSVGLTAKSKEYQALKEECANLRKRIQAIEAEMKMSRKENLHLSSEYTKLQESYKHLESLKVKLETSQLSWQCNLTDAQKDAQNTRQEVRTGPASPAMSSVSSVLSQDSGRPTSPSPSVLSSGLGSSEVTPGSPPSSISSPPPAISKGGQVEGASCATAAAAVCGTQASPPMLVKPGSSSPSYVSQTNLSPLQSQLDEAKQELTELRTSCEEKTEQITSLQKQLQDMSHDYQSLQSKTRVVSLLSSVPLLMLLFALLMAVYPWLEGVTSALS
ncbi:sarcolemmal membrane-associated protein-like [Elysia marginata]|uniref:Sarcolemmal membrane-associated protein-like n=1 Tax=Elysia marginata TaxID=1093978 RepID=A0AAV4EGY5_9GAST|nr:sarcolemmal membrane-associated protein-like [Elysia marginata]